MEDVQAFPGHIVRDSKTNLEIVVPVIDENDQLIAVFDVDSTKFSTFDNEDQLWLEKILNTLFGK